VAPVIDPDAVKAGVVVSVVDTGAASALADAGATGRCDAVPQPDIVAASAADPAATSASTDDRDVARPRRDGRWRLSTAGRRGSRGAR